MILDQLIERLSEELDWVCSLSPYVWERFAEAVEHGYDPIQLRSGTLECCYRAVAYLYRETIMVATSLPWSLALGDVHQNVLDLMNGPEPIDAVSLNIYRLARCGTSINLQP